MKASIKDLSSASLLPCALLSLTVASCFEPFDMQKCWPRHFDVTRKISIVSMIIVSQARPSFSFFFGTCARGREKEGLDKLSSKVLFTLCHAMKIVADMHSTTSSRVTNVVMILHGLVILTGTTIVG